MDEGSMTDATQPPVNEVVYSIGFDRMRSLVPPRLGMSLGDLIASHPKTEIQPPYDMQLELPLEKQPTAVAAPKIDFLGSGQINMRYWLISSDEISVVQLQPNYLATNWRRRSPDDEYPGYSALREHFVDVYNQVNEAVTGQEDGPLRPRQAELTYVNLLRPDSVWHSHSEMHRVVEMTFNELDDYEQLGISYTRALRHADGEFVGRLYVTAQPAIDIARQHPVINLTLTARSAPLNRLELAAALDFVDVAHSAVTQAFCNVTTERARRIWGLL
jgi:uncharacterized protein (TIGR04255 family)